MAHFVLKNSFFNIYPLLPVCLKKLFKQIQIFPQDFPIFKNVKKNRLSEYFSARF